MVLRELSDEEAMTMLKLMVEGVRCLRCEKAHGLRGNGGSGSRRV